MFIDQSMQSLPNVVLVHGAQLRQVLADQPGPTLVAGHSYGGQIITALGTDAPNVIGLVYIAAFGLDEGESIQDLISRGSPTPATAHLHIDAKGFAWLPQEDFVNHFAADVDRVKANVMYAVQQPLLLSTYGEKMGAPAWKTLPSWFLVAKEDQVIPPDAERAFAQRMRAATEEVKSSHLIMVSHPDRVTSLIEKAAQDVPVTVEPRTKKLSGQACRGTPGPSPAGYWTTAFLI